MEWMERNVSFTMFVRMKKNNRLTRGCLAIHCWVKRLGLFYFGMIKEDGKTSGLGERF
jgi:hypothetical protein